LGSDPAPSRSRADEIVHALLDQLSSAEKAAVLEEDSASARLRADAAESALGLAEETAEAARLNHDSASSAWQNWCEDRGNPALMNPDLLPDLFTAVEKACRLRSEILGMKEDQMRISDEIADFEEKIRALLDHCSLSSQKSPDFGLEELVSLLNSEEEKRRTLETIRSASERKQKEYEESLLLFNQAEERLFTFISGFGALDPADLRRMERLSRERQKLEESIRISTEEIRRISGLHRYEAIRRALPEYDPILSPSKITGMEEEHSGLLSKLAEIQRRQGELGLAKRQIEEDNTLSPLISREAGLLEELCQLNRQWAVFKAASTILSEAVEHFERDRQPNILREAGHFFSGFTNGQYTRIVMPIDGSDLYVEEESGARKKTDELSRGTAEQLYLALRFGYIKDYADTSVPIPLIFDDIMVNFDSERRRQACRAIGDLGDTCQVLYFTCHPETADELIDLVPGAVRIEIGEG
ncbi:MAG: hypothetical protein Q7J09_10765, partial [Methanocalculus sp.]|uniref:ATP-binding protein n=1 Tax=Methanocalculus sp. TaxID=2004547 RepID=UPI00271B847D